MIKTPKRLSHTYEPAMLRERWLECRFSVSRMKGCREAEQRLKDEETRSWGDEMHTNGDTLYTSTSSTCNFRPGHHIWSWPSRHPFDEVGNKSNTKCWSERCYPLIFDLIMPGLIPPRSGSRVLARGPARRRQGRAKRTACWQSSGLHARPRLRDLFAV